MCSSRSSHRRLSSSNWPRISPVEAVFLAVIAPPGAPRAVGASLVCGPPSAEAPGRCRWKSVETDCRAASEPAFAGLQLNQPSGFNPRLACSGEAGTVCRLRMSGISRGCLVPSHRQVAKPSCSLTACTHSSGWRRVTQSCSLPFGTGGRPMNPMHVVNHRSCRCALSSQCFLCYTGCWRERCALSSLPWGCRLTCIPSGGTCENRRDHLAPRCR